MSISTLSYSVNNRSCAQMSAENQYVNLHSPAIIISIHFFSIYLGNSQYRITEHYLVLNSRFDLQRYRTHIKGSIDSYTVEPLLRDAPEWEQQPLYNVH